MNDPICCCNLTRNEHPNPTVRPIHRVGLNIDVFPPKRHCLDCPVHFPKPLSERIKVNVCISDEALNALEEIRMTPPHYFPKKSRVRTYKPRARMDLYPYFHRHYNDLRSLELKALHKWSNRPRWKSTTVSLTFEQIIEVFTLAEQHDIYIERLRHGDKIPTNLLGQFLDAVLCGQLEPIRPH